jgi:hypothetical protein
VTDSAGFAPFIFVEDDEDGDPFAETTVPPYGPVVVWQIPGFEINGMNGDASLSLEVLVRPVAGVVPPEDRTLWYWNVQSQAVERAPVTAAFHLLARNSRSRTLAPNDLTAPEPLLLANSILGEQGFHNHGLLSYALDNEPPAAVGAYGFFARLLSDSYAPSESFLVVLNHGIAEYAQMILAALAVNAAATDMGPIPGDYDGNGMIEMSDYDLWRACFG